jgi:hypothetical protein
MDTRIPGTDDAGAGRHLSFRTTCGRDMRVSHLSLGGSHHPAQRVSLGIGASSAAESGTWAGLTASEARWLAAALLAQAAACDEYPGRPAAWPSGGASGGPSGGVSGGPSGQSGHPAT